ncbi:MAG: galactokinase family protein [Pyrinomonadaceae bacterium]
MQLREQRMIRRLEDVPPDTSEFIKLLGSLGGNSRAQGRGLLDEGTELIIARAPGRLDVMGGIADYSGSLVLQMPIAEATHVASNCSTQREATRRLKIISLSPDRNT